MNVARARVLNYPYVALDELQQILVPNLGDTWPAEQRHATLKDLDGGASASIHGKLRCFTNRE